MYKFFLKFFFYNHINIYVDIGKTTIRRLNLAFINENLPLTSFTWHR